MTDAITEFIAQGAEELWTELTAEMSVGPGQELTAQQLFGSPQQQEAAPEMVIEQPLDLEIER